MLVTNLDHKGCTNVFLNDVEIENAYEADDELGYVVFVTTEQANSKLTEKEFTYIKEFGKVRLEFNGRK